MPGSVVLTLEPEFLLKNWKARWSLDSRGVEFCCLWSFVETYCPVKVVLFLAEQGFVAFAPLLAPGRSARNARAA